MSSKPSGDKLQIALAQLEALRDDPSEPTARQQLLAAVMGKQSIVVAAAARIAGEAGVQEVIDALPAAFERFMTNPVKTDPQCRAKIAIAEALYRLDYDAEAVFLPGVRHVQMEPVWGGKQDTAADLRAACIMGLVRMSHPRALVEAAHLLADPERPARVAAAQAIAYSTNSDVGVPLLRFKLLGAPDEPLVMGAALIGLLQLAGAESVEFVAGFLDADDPAVVEAAAMALGESRLETALIPLRSMAEASVIVSRRRVAMLAIAILRVDHAWSYLLDTITSGPAGAARDAVAALAIYGHDGALCRRIESAAAGRDDVDLSELREAE